MKFKNFFTVFSLIIVFLSGCGMQNNGSGNSSANPRIIDHNNVNASVIPDNVITQIKQMNVYFEHASVGGNVVDGLISLENSNSRYQFSRLRYNTGNQPTSLELITIANWFDANNGFVDYMRGNPGLDSKISYFETSMNTDIVSPSKFASHVDVAMFKFCWIDDSGISGNAQTEFNNVRTVMETLEGQYPGTVFIWWTMPIDTSGNTKRDNYNTLVRNYCSSNNKFLMDIADIECHDPSGNQLRDSVGEYLYMGYTSTVDQGHLYSAGMARVANAWWIMLARICGWNP